jgi:hypothetical protein
MKALPYLFIYLLLLACQQEPIQISEPQEQIGFHFSNASDIYLEEGKDSVIYLTIEADPDITSEERVYIDFINKSNDKPVPIRLMLNEYELFSPKYTFDYVDIDGSERSLLTYTIVT